MSLNSLGGARITTLYNNLLQQVSLNLPSKYWFYSWRASSGRRRNE